ncbi:MAG: right-handed parallel beta-helix repeat-containing protein [Clostridia bacterium]|nr:right-handed parallel beta-helix repeat-containing protein [Clostridia bacterium]
MKKILSLFLAAAIMLICTAESLAANNFGDLTLENTSSTILISDRTAEEITIIDGEGSMGKLTVDYLTEEGYYKSSLYNSGEAKIKIQPKITISGKYKLSYYNAQYSNGTDVVARFYDGINDEELSSTYFSQKTYTDPEGWIELGEFDMKAGGDAYITIGYDTRYTGIKTFSGKRIVFCAFKAELISEAVDADSFYMEIPEPEKEKEEYVRTLAKKDVYIQPVKQNAVKIYVKSGNINGDGSFENPYATIQEAKERVKQIKKNGYPQDGVAVLVMGGVYSIPEGLNFTAEDSGTEESPVIYSAYNNEEVTFTTAKYIPRSGFKKLTDENVLKRIKKADHDKVYYVDFADLGVDNIENPTNSKQIIDVVSAGYTNAKWPKSGRIELGGPIDLVNPNIDANVIKDCNYLIDNPGMLNWDKDDVDANGRIFGTMGTMFTVGQGRIADIDSENMTLMITRTTDSSNYNVDASAYFYNLLSEMSDEGDYVIDYLSKKVCFIPVDNNEGLFISMSESGIAYFDYGSEYINMYKIDWRYATNDLITTHGNNIFIAGCDFSNGTKMGVYMWGINSTVRDCNFYNLGDTAVSMRGDTKAGASVYLLNDCNNLVENCIFHDVGLETSNAATGIGYNCGAIFRHNYIYNVPKGGMGIIGVGNTVEYNVLENVAYDSDDVGGLYAYTGAIGYGNKYRYNIVKDIPGGKKSYTNGIYLDDRSSGFEVYGNIVINAYSPFQSSGKNNSFKNNIVYCLDGSTRELERSQYVALDTEDYAAMCLSHFDGVCLLHGDYYPKLKEKFPDAYEDYEKLINRDKVKYRPKEGVHVDNNAVFNVGEAAYATQMKKIPQMEAAGSTFNGNHYFTDEELSFNPENFFDIDFDKIREYIPDFTDIPIDEIGIYNGGFREDVQRTVFYSMPEGPKTYYPAQNAENVDTKVTFKWEDIFSKGVSAYELVIAEDEQFSVGVNRYKTQTAEYTTNLSPDKTYYWYVNTIWKMGRGNCINDGGIQSFSTVTTKELVENEYIKVKALFLNADEGEQNGKYPKGFKKEMLARINDIEALMTQAQTNEEYKTVLYKCREAENEFSTKIYRNEKLSLLYYNDFSNDALDTRPADFYVTPNFYTPERFDYRVVREENNPSNTVLMYNDVDSQAAMNKKRFYPQKYIELSVDFKYEPQSGNFAVSLYGGKTGMMVASAVFESGTLYADYNKNFIVGTLEANKWYTIKFVADVSKSSYDLYLDNTPVAQNVPMLNKLEEIRELIFTSGAEDKGVYYIDNIVVMAPDTYGINNYLSDILINGEEYKDFSADTYSYNTEYSKKELDALAVTAVPSGKYASVYILDGELAKYINVISGNGEIRQYKLRNNSN